MLADSGSFAQDDTQAFTGLRNNTMGAHNVYQNSELASTGQQVFRLTSQTNEIRPTVVHSQQVTVDDHLADQKLKLLESLKHSLDQMNRRMD